MPTSVWLDRDECRYDDALPPVCLVCGADAVDAVRTTFRRLPVWTCVVAGVVCGMPGVLVWAIAYAASPGQVTLFAPLCDLHRGVFVRRAVLTWAFAVSAVSSLAGGMTVMVVYDKPGAGDTGVYGLLAGVAAMLVFLIAAAVVSKQGAALSAVTNSDVRLKGVSEEFADALREQRHEERDRRWQQEWADD